MKSQSGALITATSRGNIAAGSSASRGVGVGGGEMEELSVGQVKDVGADFSAELDAPV